MTNHPCGELRIPKLRSGSFFPALLEWRRRVDQCLLAVVMEADLQNMPTRKVDGLVKALTVWSRRWAPTPGSPKARCLGLSSPAVVEIVRGRDPLRGLIRVSVRSCGPAPITAVSSASIRV